MNHILRGRKASGPTNHQILSNRRFKRCALALVASAMSAMSLANDDISAFQPFKGLATNQNQVTPSQVVGWQDKEPELAYEDKPSNASEGDPDWKLYRFPRALCMNNTQATLAVNDFGQNREEQENLFVYFQGGGACFDALSCSQTQWSNGYDVEHFLYQKNGEEKAYIEANASIAKNYEGKGAFDRGLFIDDERSPYHGYSQVVVPYCSGDAYLGSYNLQEYPKTIKGNPNNWFTSGNFAQAGEHAVMFRGYYNVIEYIAWLKEQYPKAKNIVLKGHSSGSIGAIYHFKRFHDAFTDNQETLQAETGNSSPVSMSLIEDSGFLLLDSDVNHCAREGIIDAWDMKDGYKATLGKEYRPSDVYYRFMDPIRLAIYDTPHTKVAHIRSGQDQTVTRFYDLLYKHYKPKDTWNCYNENTYPHNDKTYLTSITNFIEEVNSQSYEAEVRTWFLPYNKTHTWVLAASGGLPQIEPWKLNMYRTGSSFFRMSDWLHAMEQGSDSNNYAGWNSFRLNPWACIFKSKDYQSGGPLADLCGNHQ